MNQSSHRFIIHTIWFSINSSYCVPLCSVLFRSSFQFSLFVHMGFPKMRIPQNEWSMGKSIEVERFRVPKIISFCIDCLGFGTPRLGYVSKASADDQLDLSRSNLWWLKLNFLSNFLVSWWILGMRI